MKKLFTIIALLHAFISHSQNYQLVWSDEFNGNSVDLSKWAFQNGNGCPSLCGWGNGELETYTNDPKNISVANGILTMTAIKENVNGSSFTASKLRTLGLHAWKYGRFEARMRLPLGRGLWPAFWMLPTNNKWPTTGEIDIMEYRGDMPKQTFATLHYGQPWPDNRYDGTTYSHSQNLSDDFHTYAVEWTEDKIVWFFDNIAIKTETKNPNSLNPPSNSTSVWPWNTDFYIILNFAVGGGFAGSPSVSQVEMTKPTFEVDYVRVYSEAAPAPITISGKIEAESYTTMQGVDTENTNDLDGGKNVGWIDDKDWMEYDIDVVKSANYDFAFRSASLGAGGTLSLEVDGNLISNPVVLPITGGWQTWLTTVLKNVSLSKGIHKLRLNVINGGFNLNYINVTETVAGASNGFLRASGKNIVNNNGNFQIKAINIGNYMVQEGYMLNLGGGYQHIIKQKIADVVGQTNMEKFYVDYKSNYLTKADIDSIAKWGFNAIRLPMHYNLFTELGKPNVFIESGFAMVDQIVSWCKANNIYVILDLHAAPGGQSSGDISDYISGQSSLWEGVNGSTYTSAQNRAQTIALWTKFAQRYANEQTVGGYDLINETNWTIPGNTLLANLMKDITSAIRTVDNNHLLFVEGNSYANDYNGLTPKWDNNMAYSFHKYWNDVNDASLNFVTSLRDEQNVPVWLGEFGENSNHWIGEAVVLMNKHNIGWALWPYKKMGSVSGALAFKEPNNWNLLANYINDKGAKPAASVGQAILDEMVQNVKLANCSINRGYLFSLFPDYANPTKPFAVHNIPSKIPASEYDEGRNGVSYSDVVFRTTQFGVNGGDYTAWNTGWYFRNDGVDLQFSNAENSPVVGWIEDAEWMQYTVNVLNASNYVVKTRIAGFGGKVSLSVDGVTVIDKANITSTGGWDTWQTISLGNINLTKGNHVIRVTINTAGFNINYFDFIDPLVTGIDENALEDLAIACPSIFHDQTQLKVNTIASFPLSIKAIDCRGIEVFSSDKYSTNEQIQFGSTLPSGMYILHFVYQNKMKIVKVVKM